MNAKSMLLIMPKYFGYENYIIKEFEAQGYKVELIYENVGNVSIWHRIAIYFLKVKREKILNIYYKNIIEKVTENISKIVVIRGSTLTQQTICTIKKKWPRATWTLYQWDSIRNNQNAEYISPYFDRVLTFDMDDAKNNGWVYRPLFFIPKLCNETIKDIDFTYVCVVHSNRMAIYNKLCEIKKARDMSGFMHMFVLKLTFFRHKFIMKDPVYEGIKLKNVKFNGLSLEETNQKYDRSKIVVDYTHPSQNGYTMRTIESMGHKCKLITNNQKIKEADFFNENNILIYDNTDVIIPEEFLNLDYQEYPQSVLYKYSIRSFISDLIGE